VIVGIQIEYDGVPGDLHGRSTGDSESFSLGTDETIEKITIRSFEEGSPKLNNLIFSLTFVTSTDNVISVGRGRGKTHETPEVQEDVIPTQDNDIPGGSSLCFITGYVVDDKPRDMLGQLRFYFRYP